MTSKNKVDLNLYDVIRYPLVTEKTSSHEDRNQLAFVVARDATKPQIKKAIELVFGVKVDRVNTLVHKGKTKRFRGRPGIQSDKKKAYITLVEGQTIDIASGI
jgi:large subunit ribosomal protein L23